MKTIRTHRGFRDTLNKTTLPLALTNQPSATGQFPAQSPMKKITHHLPNDALEFVNHIVESLELSGGLA